MFNSEFRFDLSWYQEAERKDPEINEWKNNRLHNQEAMEIALGRPPAPRYGSTYDSGSGEVYGPVGTVLRVYEDEPFRMIRVNNKYVQWMRHEPVSSSNSPLWNVSYETECDCRRRKRIKEAEDYRRRMLMTAGIIALM